MPGRPNPPRRNPKATARSLKPTARFTKAHLGDFRKLLLERRARLIGSYSRLESDATSGAGSGEISAVPIHMADLGSDAYEKDMALGLMESERQELREIHEALRRIERGQYGVCESCSMPIPLARLRALPYARMCVECKQKEETVS